MRHTQSKKDPPAIPPVPKLANDKIADEKFFEKQVDEESKVVDKVIEAVKIGDNRRCSLVVESDDGSERKPADPVPLAHTIQAVDKPNEVNPEQMGHSGGRWGSIKKGEEGAGNSFMGEVISGNEEMSQLQIGVKGESSNDSHPYMDKRMSAASMEGVNKQLNG